MSDVIDALEITLRDLMGRSPEQSYTAGLPARGLMWSLIWPAHGTGDETGCCGWRELLWHDDAFRRKNF